jgi:hypothetical protein
MSLFLNISPKRKAEKNIVESGRGKGVLRK